MLSKNNIWDQMNYAFLRKNGEKKNLNHMNKKFVCKNEKVDYK